MPREVNNDSPLSKRQTQIFQVMVDGGPTETVRIAAELSIAPKTVSAHLREALIRLHATSKTQAVVLALKAGYISLEPSMPNADLASNVQRSNRNGVM